jgi:phosphatidylglycerol:prolipoprotein diacylglycerol transferase
MISAYMHFPSWLKPEIVPGLPFRWYGLMYILAFATAYLLVMHQIKKERIDRTADDVLSIFIWAIVGLLLGSRL